MVLVKYHVRVEGVSPNEQGISGVLYQRIETAKYNNLGGISPNNILTIQKDVVGKFTKRFNKYKQVSIALKLLKLETFN